MGRLHEILYASRIGWDFNVEIKQTNKQKKKKKKKKKKTHEQLHFLARLYESTGTVIAQPPASALAAASALIKMLKILRPHFF